MISFAFHVEHLQRPDISGRFGFAGVLFAVGRGYAPDAGNPTSLGVGDVAPTYMEASVCK